LTPLIFGWDPFSNAAGRQPWVKVKYLTKRYVSPYPGGADFAAIFSTDDFITTNTALLDTVNGRNGKITFYGAEDHLGANADQADIDVVAQWRVDGAEIGTHSRIHDNPNGLTVWQQVGGVTEESLGFLAWDASPQWLYDKADSLDGNSRLADPLWGKSMALPNNIYSAEVMNAIVDAGYLTMRSQSMGAFTRDFYYATPLWAAARGDSIMSGAPPEYGRRPRNMIGLPPTMTAASVVGDTSSTPTMDQVSHNMRRLVSQIRGQDRGELVLFWHTTKKRPGPDWYEDGVDFDEAGAMFGVVNEYGGAFMTASELGRHRRNFGTAVATPAGYAADDSLAFTVEDQVWYVPDGQDGRFIRGVK